MSKFLDLRRNLKVLWGIALFLGLGYGSFRFVKTNPEWFFPIPTPNGRHHILFFQESKAVQQGLQSGMVGYVYLPESETQLLGPQVLKSKWMPAIVKNWFGKQIGTWEHRFYEQNFSELIAEARGQGELKVLRVEKVPQGYRLAVSCRDTQAGKNWIEASLKRGEEAVYADSFPLNCSRAREVQVQLEGQARPDPSRVKSMQLNDEIEARLWIRAEGKYLSGDEGIAIEDSNSAVTIVASGTQEAECLDDAERVCTVPYVRVKAKAAGSNPVILVGDTRATLPLQILSPSASNR